MPLPAEIFTFKDRSQKRAKDLISKFKKENPLPPQIINGKLVPHKVADEKALENIVALSHTIHSATKDPNSNERVQDAIANYIDLDKDSLRAVNKILHHNLRFTMYFSKKFLRNVTDEMLANKNFYRIITTIHDSTKGANSFAGKNNSLAAAECLIDYSNSNDAEKYNLDDMIIFSLILSDPDKYNDPIEAVSLLKYWMEDGVEDNPKLKSTSNISNKAHHAFNSTLFETVKNQKYRRNPFPGSGKYKKFNRMMEYTGADLLSAKDASAVHKSNIEDSLDNYDTPVADLKSGVEHRSDNYSTALVLNSCANDELENDRELDSVAVVNSMNG